MNVRRGKAANGLWLQDRRLYSVVRGDFAARLSVAGTMMHGHGPQPRLGVVDGGVAAECGGTGAHRLGSSRRSGARSPTMSEVLVRPVSHNWPDVP